MKQSLVIALAILSSLLFCNLYSQNWTPLEMHAGGKVTGLIGHPTNANTIFARTDVAVLGL